MSLVPNASVRRLKNKARVNTRLQERDDKIQSKFNTQAPDRLEMPIAVSFHATVARETQFVHA